MKTYQPSGKDVKRSTINVDAKGEILGRFATKIAGLLMGKGKATYSRHIDSGDNVVVVNVEKLIVTGKKASNKIYRGHSGYPGGFKEESYEKLMKQHPERILEHAVSGMLPDNKLKAERLKRLTLVVGDKVVGKQ